MNVIGLAALELQLGDTGAASTDVGIAMARGYGEAAVALNAGLLADRLGNGDWALMNLSNAVIWDPPLAGAELLASIPRTVTKAQIIAAAHERTNPLDAALILAYAGDPTQARAQLEAQPASSTRNAYIATVIGLTGDGTTALAMFDALLDKNPSDWFSAAMAARTAHRLGMQREADRYASWAILIQGDSAPAVIADASVVPVSPTEASASLPLNYPWSTYLRPIKPFLFMPSLTHIGVR
jgi:hypothetical protein